MSFVVVGVVLTSDNLEVKDSTGTSITGG